MRAGSAPAEVMAATRAGTTPLAIPARPEWAAPTTPASGSAISTPGQSADRTPRTRPGTVVKLASLGPAAVSAVLIDPVLPDPALPGPALSGPALAGLVLAGSGGSLAGPVTRATVALWTWRIQISRSGVSPQAAATSPRLRPTTSGRSPDPVPMFSES